MALTLLGQTLSTGLLRNNGLPFNPVSVVMVTPIGKKILAYILNIHPNGPFEL